MEREALNRGATSDHYLLFRSRSCVGALALADVREIMRPLPVVSLAGAPAFVLGIAVICGAPCPVMDTARLLSSADSAPVVTSPKRFIALRIGSRSACLAVDAVLDVRALQADQLQRAPPLLSQGGAPLLPLIGALDRELLIVLSAARMVPESVWASMQTAGIPA